MDSVFTPTRVIASWRSAIRQAKEGGHNLMDDFKDEERAAYSDQK